ncbi:MAG: HEAT repeat domain-containing protein, partial [Pirellulaceae bacterium]|nr:HEAT repeat domain-containing protein [Pirellulaceae bacterium]
MSFPRILMVVFTWFMTIHMPLPADDFPKVFNTEAEGQHPPTGPEMVKLIELPPGFQATLFATDPAVQQPICMDFDDRGRLWVAENYSYSGGPYETKLRDRVIILEDKDGDGVHDSRKVFWDKGFMLTSLTWGFGGLWILHDGTLSFIPDRNADDVPDAEPEIFLDGWSKECGHNFVSGLTWGPDGWLYGRHGIVDTSYPGIPGTPTADRPRMNCGVWRYHPTRRSVEVVCNGTTNPWGLDYNADGQFFMTNNVQGHLWHAIPGAHFQRMYGQDFNPHAYELMDMTADHYHWDTKTKWNESRDGVANDLGGGHSHVGGMIYHGDNFPEKYRGQIFMCNTHGRRVNVNRLDRQGSGYVGKREPDFMLVKNNWFRGVDIKLGPEGAMYISDWSDNGECHDHDGIHRTSGRIYRISYGLPKPVTNFAEKLKATPLDRYDWWGRHARRLRQETVGSKMPLAEIGTGPTLRSLLLRETFDLNSPELIEEAFKANDPLAVAYAVQLAGANSTFRQRHLSSLVKLASQPQAANVLLSLVSILQKYEPAGRWSLSAALLGCEDNARTIAAENNLTLMTWYGIEPVAMQTGMLELLESNPKLQQFAVRRRAHEHGTPHDVSAPTLEFVSRHLAQPAQLEQSAKLLVAFKTGLAGRARVQAPPAWQEIEGRLRAAKHPELNLAVDALAVMFGDGTAMSDLRRLAQNGNADAVAREQAIQALAQAKDTEAVPILFNLLNDRAIGDAAIEALTAFDHPDTPSQLLKRLSGFKDGNKARALDTLASREAYATQLAKAIDDGRVNAHDLTPSQVRQLLAFNNPQIKSIIDSKWGIVQDTPQARLDTIAKWQKHLTADVLGKADRAQGAEQFKKNCANCHKLFGEGKALGPDLTGANRS